MTFLRIEVYRTGSLNNKVFLFRLSFWSLIVKASEFHIFYKLKNALFCEYISWFILRKKRKKNHYVRTSPVQLPVQVSKFHGHSSLIAPNWGVKIMRN